MINRPVTRYIPLLILLLALALRLYGLETQSMWADEGGTLALAARAPAVILRDTLADVHPPLYYWILHAWMGMFGVNVAAARGLSAIVGALAALVTYILAKRWFGPTAGWVAGLTAALSPLAIHYSQEARMYALAMLLAALLFLVLDCWVSAVLAIFTPTTTGIPSRWVAAKVFFGLYLAVAAALLTTHYFAVAIVASAALAGMYQLGRNKHYRQLIIFTLAHLPLAILYLAMVVASSTRLTTWTAAKEPTSPLFVLTDALQAFSIGMNGPATWGWWSLLFAGFLLTGLLVGKSKTGRLMTTVWLGIPMALMILISLGQPYYKPRFLLPVLPAFHILVGAGVAGLANRIWSRSQPSAVSRQRSGAQATNTPLARPLNPSNVTLLFCTAMILITASLPLYREWFDPGVWRDDYRGAAQAISATASANDVLILNGQSQIDTLNVYLHTPQPRILLPRFRPLDQTATEAELTQIASRHRRIYGLFYVIEESDPQGIIANWLDSHAFPSGSHWYGDLQLRSWETGDLSDQMRPIAAQFGDLLLLEGALTPQTLTAGEAIRIQLAWQANSAPDQPLSLFVHLLDAQGQLIAQSDQPLALQPLAAGVQWNSRSAVLIPPATAAGRYQIMAGVYNPATGQRLRLADGADTLELGTVEVR